MKLNSSLLKKLIKEAMADMTGEFGADDPTEHSPAKEPLLNKLFELLSDHFRPSFDQSQIIEDELQKLYTNIQMEMRMGE
tara:strand:- start:23 stop:262 length:240 start_codon:yes stop_codon:yes gene_type:complete